MKLAAMRPSFLLFYLVILIIKFDKVKQRRNAPKETVKVNVSNRLELHGYEIVRAQYFSTLRNPAMTISNGKLRFNTACLQKFENVEYIELLLNSVNRSIAIRPCSKDNPNTLDSEIRQMDGYVTSGMLTRQNS